MPLADTAILLAYYESLLALLQQLSQTKNGAISVLKSGLFESVRESRLFAADPDLGIGQFTLILIPVLPHSIIANMSRHRQPRCSSKVLRSPLVCNPRHRLCRLFSGCS